MSSANGIDGSLNLSTPEINLPILAASGGANAIVGGGIPVTHPHQILGSTPLSQIGCPPLNLEQYSAQLSPSCGDSEDEIDSELESNADEMGSNYSLHSKRQKRGILPKHATSVMRAWLFQHLVVNIHKSFPCSHILLPFLSPPTSSPLRLYVCAINSFSFSKTFSLLSHVIVYST